MKFMEHSFKTTTHGRAALIACLDLSKPPDICRVAFGSGKVDEGTNLADVHELLEYVADGMIGSRRHKDDHFYFTIQYANLNHPEIKTFPLSEFIVYIRDPETGAETDLLYGTLGDYRQPVPQYHEGMPPCVWNLPLVLVASDELEVHVSAPPGLVTYDELEDAVAQALDKAAGGKGLLTDSSKGVPNGLATLDGFGKVPETQLPWKHHVIAARPRDPSKPDYGMGGGGEDGGEISLALETGPYTGTTEVGVVVSGVLYDAHNMSTHGDIAPNGTILIKTEEKENG